jgi:hypothetical protein
MKRAALLAAVVAGTSALLVDLSVLRVSAQRPEMRSLASLYDVTTAPSATRTATAWPTRSPRA